MGRREIKITIEQALRIENAKVRIDLLTERIKNASMEQSIAVAANNRLLSEIFQQAGETDSQGWGLDAERGCLYKEE